MEKEKVKEKLSQRISRLVAKGIGEYSLIADGDRVLVAVSGGKDSLCLLEFLAKRAKIFIPKFEVEAIHVRMENIRYETDTAYLEDFAASLGVKLHVASTRFDLQEGCRKPACFLCSWYRRKAILNLAQELGCNKIAFGHHMDDIVHTALMNTLYQGHFSTMPVRLQLRKMPLTIIRPLCLVHEADILHYAKLCHYQPQIKTCPHEHKTTRTSIASHFAEIERIHPDARYSVWRALTEANKLIE